MNYASKIVQNKISIEKAYDFDKQTSSRFEYLKNKISDYLGFTTVFDRVANKLESKTGPLRKKIQETKQELEQLLHAWPDESFYGIDKFGKQIQDSINTCLETGNSGLIEKMFYDMGKDINKEILTTFKNSIAPIEPCFISFADKFNEAMSLKYKPTISKLSEKELESNFLQDQKDFEMQLKQIEELNKKNKLKSDIVAKMSNAFLLCEQYIFEYRLKPDASELYGKMYSKQITSPIFFLELMKLGVERKI